ncbi:MAG: condensation domain-containing protein, partial [Nostoc sp.]
MFHFIISILLIYLSERYDKNDLTVGVSLLNRNKKEYKEAIGLFVSMLPFRVEFNGDETLSELMEKVRSLLRQDYRHQRFPIGEMKRIPALNCSSNEYLYDIILSYEKHDYSETLCNTQKTCTPLYSGEQKLPLIVYVREFDQTRDVK